jgi:uncharacterized membrane protein YdbT with pleckstrin-like domain
MSYTEPIARAKLEDGEKIILVARKNLCFAFQGYIIGLPFLFMIGVSLTVGGAVESEFRGLLGVGLLALLLTGILIVVLIEKMKKEILLVTNKNVIIEEGILAYYYTKIPLTLISNITVGAGICERLFETGSIRIETRWTQNISVVEYIKKPLLILEIISKCKEGKSSDKLIFL